MKNIYIIGPPRSGKTTLANMIKEKFPKYNQISFEAIRNAFIETQPELNMNFRNSNARKDILPKHIITFSSWNNKMTNNPTLVEGDFCNIEELSKLIDSNDVIICLGLGCRNIDDIIEGIISNDKENDYTKNYSKQELKKHFYDIEIKDKENYNYCINNNIKYYDTYQNREEVFREILNNIE